jgi:hypothetical protein
VDLGKAKFWTEPLEALKDGDKPEPAADWSKAALNKST